MIKVLYIANRSEVFSGGQISLLELLWGLDRSKVRPSVLCPGEGGMADRIRGMGIPVHIWDMPSARTFNVAKLREKGWEIAGIAEKEDVDIIHTNGTRAQFYAALSVKAIPAKIVWHVRESIADNYLYDCFLASRSGRIICVSKAAARERFGRLPMFNDRIRVIYNGVDTERFGADADERRLVREEFGVGGGDILLGIVGLIEPLKGHADLLKAVGALKRKGYGVKVLIAGKTVDGGYETKLKSLVKEIEINDSVIFAGQRDDVNAVLSALDIFVLASRREGFSRALLEAMACSLPIVATAVGGNIEALEDGKSGVMVPYGDPEGLSAAIKGLIDDPEQARRLGKEARIRVGEAFSIKEHVTQVQRLYGELA